MSGFLLDTNIISELKKPRPEANVTAWIESTDESLLYLSVLTTRTVTHHSSHLSRFLVCFLLAASGSFAQRRCKS